MNNNSHQPQFSPSTHQRTGDPRIYLVSGLFFICIISGGVFLGLYIFLPLDETQSWYPTAGLVLVSVPWSFWLLTYLYRCTCIRFGPKYTTTCPPCKASSPRRSTSVHEMEPSAIATNDDGSSHLHSNAPQQQQPLDDGGRHVHFGGVVVIRDYDNNDDYNYDDNNSNISGSIDQDVHEGFERRFEVEHGCSSTSSSLKEEKLVGSRESEIPLTLSGPA